MKVTIAEITVTSREVELPDTCPHCGLDLRSADDDTLVQQEYAAVDVEGHFEGDDFEGSTHESETIAVCGYLCYECRKSVLP